MALLDRLKHQLFRRLGADAQALVDTAVLAMLADQRVTEVEIDTALGLLLEMPWFRGVDRLQLRGYVQDAACRVRPSDLPRLARTFTKNADAREVQLGICAYVLMCDRQMTDAERAWLDDLAGRLAVDQPRLAELLADIGEYLEG